MLFSELPYDTSVNVKVARLQFAHSLQGGLDAICAPYLGT